MIQRIQSLYLAAGAIALVVLLFLDTPWQTFADIPALRWGATGLFSVTVGLGVASIFQYGNRKRQRKSIVGVQALTITSMVVLVAGLYLTQSLSVQTTDGLNVPLLVALALPIVAYSLFFLARRGVERDIELIRSMDRLR